MRNAVKIKEEFAVENIYVGVVIRESAWIQDHIVHAILMQASASVSDVSDRTMFPYSNLLINPIHLLTNSHSHSPIIYLEDIVY
jgi:hypothetical protein